MFAAKLNHHQFIDDIKDAIQSLWYRKVRSILSATGIAIGTMALVAMLSISEGAKQQALEKIQALGVDSIRIESNLIAAKLSDSSNLATGIKHSDIDSIQSTFPDAQIGIFKHIENANTIIQGQHQHTDVLLVTHPWSTSDPTQLKQGRAFQNSDLSLFKQVCIVGSDIYNNKVNLIGQVISWQNNSCQVIGSLKNKAKMLIEGSALSELDINKSIIVPLNQYISITQHLSGLTINLDSQDLTAIKQAAASIEALIDKTHPVKDYSILIPASLMEKLDHEQQLFTLIMGTIAGLSLLVGGIGIMNVMLAHLAEQTREIGLRLALGAQKQRIIMLFLSYSLMLALLGTLMGLFGGMFFALAIQYYAAWPVTFSLFSLTIGPLFAILAGVGFGLYPAMKAAKIVPVSALRQV